MAENVFSIPWLKVAGGNRKGEPVRFRCQRCGAEEPQASAYGDGDYLVAGQRFAARHRDCAPAPEERRTDA